MSFLGTIARCVLPEALRCRLRGTALPLRVRDWRDLRRVEPVSRIFGLDRGQCIDRHYIEAFLDAHRADIRGRVLEIGDAAYTRQFGDAAVSRSDVLHATARTPGATLVGDLASGAGIPSAAFDCVILTQTLPFIYDVRAALATVRRSLVPGGIVLATVPGISQLSRYDMDRWGDFWRFTPLSARRVFEESFGVEGVAVRAHGNVLVACAFLPGLAVHEVEASELAHGDAAYPLVIPIRAVAGGSPDAGGAIS